MHAMYWRLKHKLFPLLLDRPDITPEDKILIREMLPKPWHPYLRRHISLTAKARLVNEYTLRLNAGWTKTSKMVEIYTHELGGESSRAFLEAAGIFAKEGQVSVLQPKACPNCNEPNKVGESQDYEDALDKIEGGHPPLGRTAEDWEYADLMIHMSLKALKPDIPCRDLSLLADYLSGYP
ncbi:MAG: hypothetical protein MN733_20365 [Nitrososphaera sp.]|nr:hypothetical protein [Nitrososphaera sp.]